jgi:hypothetical protein
MILKFESLEGRQLLAVAPRTLPDLVASSFQTQNNLDWGNTFQATGSITNQGGGATTNSFKVDVYASPGPSITSASVLIGEVIVPPGLNPGSSATFTQSFTLPGSPLPSTAQTNQVFIDLKVNPNRSVLESNYRNNQLQGEGFDTSIIAITPPIPANLMGTALGITPNSVQWGSTVNLTAQVTNNAAGGAPPTRARIVLTPAGLTPGSTSDFTVGSIAVPAIAAWHTSNVTAAITLPLTPPSALASSTEFTLSMVEDADFLTNTSIASRVQQGLGLDQAQINILPNPIAPPNTAHLPDLAAGTVLTPTTGAWGQAMQVSTTVENVGLGDTGPVRVRFLLAGTNGTLASAIFLADAIIPGIKAGTSQTIQQTLQIPGRLPSGLQVNGTGVARILVEVDPENSVDETFKTNNLASSGPIVLRLPGTGGNTLVPTQPTGDPALALAVNGASTAATTTAKRLNTRLKPQKHGLKAFPDKVKNEVTRFFKHL